MDQKERERRISHATRQFEVHKAYASYWQAMATTGAAKLRNTAQGREPTEEERAAGHCIGWRQKTDDEKVKDALDTSLRHIQHMNECHDTISELMWQEDS